MKTREDSITTAEEKRQIRTGLLVWASIWLANKAAIYLTQLLLPASSYAASELALKGFDCAVSMGLIAYTVRKWRWGLDDWGFTYDARFWITLGVVVAYLGYFWFVEGMPMTFDALTVRQALTGIWEELISTVFFTLLAIKYFRTLPSLNPTWGKALGVAVSALVFTGLHAGQWDWAEATVNTLSFIVYRAVYAFGGTFLPGLAIHGTSNGQFMAFPVLLVFYGSAAFINWRMSGRGKG